MKAGRCKKNRPFRAYSDTEVSLGEPLTRFRAIPPIRVGLDFAIKRGWLFARPSVQRSRDSIVPKTQNVK
jgi:hypothetical protein